MEFQHQPVEHPAVDGLLKELRSTHVNGGALFAQFKASEKMDRRDFYRGETRPEAGSKRLTFDPSPLLASKAFRKALPELQVELPFAFDPGFQTVDLFSLDCDLVSALVHGGAYERFAGTVREAKDLVRDFCEFLMPEEAEEGWKEAWYTADLVRSWTAWNEWFKGIAPGWDATWVLFDWSSDKVSFLCITDTD